MIDATPQNRRLAVRYNAREVLAMRVTKETLTELIAAVRHSIAVSENPTAWTSLWQEAQHPDIDSERLRELTFSHPEHLMVQVAVASNPNTDGQTREHLTHSKSAAVRRALLRNPSCDKDTVELLASDHEVDIRAEVAEHSRADAETLLLLSFDHEPRVRSAAILKLAECQDAQAQADEPQSA